VFQDSCNNITRIYYITWNFPRSLSVPVLISPRICAQHLGNAYQHKWYSALQSFLPEKKSLKNVECCYQCLNYLSTTEKPELR